jgi:hypothetical protein
MRLTLKAEVLVLLLNWGRQIAGQSRRVDSSRAGKLPHFCLRLLEAEQASWPTKAQVYGVVEEVRNHLRVKNLLRVGVQSR